MKTNQSRKTVFCFMILFLIFPYAVKAAADSSSKSGIPAKIAADYIHAVIEAGRTTYSQHIVNFLENKRSLKASENWALENTLLLPAQFLLASSRTSNSRGIGFRYRLMSLWPINPQNGPKTANEKLGLEEVARNPNQPFTWIIQKNGWWYFETIYPDLAITESCISCHNHHPKSPRTNFKLGDVLGGITIDLPLGRQYHPTPNEQFRLAPEIVADYVHSVLNSDRTIYAEDIVNRLKNKKVLDSSEHWEKENLLMLPAQFLLNSSDLIKQKKLGLDFRLISLWPINIQNGPANEFERIGLETVEMHPIRPYIGRTKVGRKEYFQAIYPDVAISEACVQCHNSHLKSPKKDFKLDDIMGGIVITLPLN